MDAIIDYAIKLLAMLILGLIGLAVQKLQAYLKTSKANALEAALNELILQLVEAADQKLKDEDPTGEKRLTYVEDMLVLAGHSLDNFIDAKIHAAVFNVNLNQAEISK